MLRCLRHAFTGLHEVLVHHVAKIPDHAMYVGTSISNGNQLDFLSAVVSTIYAASTCLHRTW